MDKKLALELIKKYIERQEWCVKFLSFHMKLKIDVGPYMAGITNSPYRGDVPSNSDWEYFFHGRKGIRLTNKRSGEIIDFDLRENGKTGGFSPWWMYIYIKDRIDKGILDKTTYKAFASVENWQKIFAEFLRERVIKKDKKGAPGFTLTR